MKYTTRTCHECGVRHPQPNMLRRNIEVETGYTQRSLSATEILFTPFSKNAQKSVSRRFTSPNKRKHIRNKEVWMCYSCAGVETDSEKAAREAAEKIEKAAADEKKVIDDAAQEIVDCRRVAKHYHAFWPYMIFQFPLYCLGLYIPIVSLRMKTAGGGANAFLLALLYYAITLTSLKILPFHEGFRWEIIFFAFAYSFVEYRIYSKAAKKGRKLPPPLPK